MLSRVPCPLCGLIHEVRIHGYFIRKVRDPESRDEEKIRIFGLFCAIAKERNDQYTKRILPPFVTPECNIMLSSVMVYLSENPQERINYAKAQIALGADDRRTMRRHIQMGWRMMDATTAGLTRILAEQMGFADVRPLKPGVGVYQRLSATVQEVEATVERMQGGGSEHAGECEYVHVVYAYQRTRRRGENAFEFKAPLNRILWAIGFDDTS